MPVITIRDKSSHSEAKILTQLGFNLFHFSTTVNGQHVDVIEADDDFELGKTRASRCGIPILFPFPNRIMDGKFSWEGKQYQLPLPESGGHAIHGFCLDRAWRVVDQGEDFVTGEFQLSKDATDRLEFWPADFTIQATYRLSGSALKTEFTVSNPDTKPLPWGLGTHAYFKLPLVKSSSTENVVLYANAHKQWSLENFIPTGEIVPIPESVDLRKGQYYTVLKLDNVLTDLHPDSGIVQSTIVDEGAGLEVIQSFDNRFRELVVYTPADRDAVCMEPYTCPSDAINLEANGISCGWETLQPGEVVKLFVDIAVNPIMA